MAKKPAVKIKAEAPAQVEDVPPPTKTAPGPATEVVVAKKPAEPSPALIKAVAATPMPSPFTKAGELVPVTFKRSFEGYNAGEVAGFLPETAAKLIAEGFAAPYVAK